MKKRLIILGLVAVIIVNVGCGARDERDSKLDNSYEGYSSSTDMISGAPINDSTGFSMRSNESMAPQAAMPAPAAPAIDASTGYEMDVAPSEPMLDESEAVNPIMSTRKIIRDAQLELQTMNFEAGIDYIESLTASFGGFISNSEMFGGELYGDRKQPRTALYTVRIPAEQFETFLESFGTMFHVLRQNTSSNDVTEQYYDSQARLESLEVREERLLEMLRQGNDLEHLIRLERELSEVRYEIEGIQSSLNRLDSLVSLSTIRLAVNEVIEYDEVKETPITFGERIQRAFVDAGEDFIDWTQTLVIGLVREYPTFIILIVIIGGIVILIKRLPKSKKSKGEIKRIRGIHTDNEKRKSEANGATEETISVKDTEQNAENKE
jgi:hypothetical protein